jgi:hypothetical protein
MDFRLPPNGVSRGNLVKLWRAIRLRLGGIDDGGQHLVIDAHRFGGIARLRQGLTFDRRCSQEDFRASLKFDARFGNQSRDRVVTVSVLTPLGDVGSMTDDRLLL